MYKKALHSFFLKVHPDFFHHNRSQQTVNESSVARLNELLSWAKAFKSGHLQPPPSSSFTLTFYRKPDDNMGNGETRREGSGSPVSSLAGRSMGDGSLSPTIIQSTFELPSNFAPSDNHRGTVERAVNKFLRDLLRRAACIDSVTESISEAEDATAARAEAKPLRRRPRGSQHRGAPTGPKSLLDEAVESMTLQWSLTPAPTLQELIEADQILFSRDLSPLQSAAALSTLQRHLGELNYSAWESMPLIVSNQFSIGDLTGTITIPWDFTPEQFHSFMAHNEKGVARCREVATQYASTIEQLIAELCTALELDDILVSCSHQDALRLMELLHRNRELLIQYGLSKLTLEVGNRHATRANGVVIINCSLTSEQLRPWLKAISPKLPLQQRLYELSKQMLESTLWHLKEFRTMVEPGGVDVFSNDCTYAERLQWSKELFRIGPSLAPWDWSEMTFVLSPDVDIDWANGLLALPYNFDGDALVRYVEEVQQEAKSRKREELLAASAMQREEEERRRKQQHDEELMVECQEKGERSGDDSPTVAERMRHLYRQTNPHMDEYLASSNSRVDTLPVERPLSHAVTFNSDAEAEDQLKWEGFYAEPYVDQAPTSDIDDMAHTFMLTNRWHREEAAKKMLDQLRGTYGKKSRRFEYQKMGDVLEINNAKVQPKGFPTLTRGIKPGC
ncbi:hypothetical protein, conserved [Trypanosoma brucei gambiense DAL972]|uniref:DUF4460 domain-containing protein n=1 Tax=Trypanosoma brucei gambiense (strain MHOM/CI/86/DAL972) TaxID=679716 RepID=C9ZX97_TRYB9|nr:hypothetical protein, conserved [Trypanosoma brucei gambiense DAL972]CBH14041.1 hypothetical protein, conserved [Trypanosoma brucei gambiense DAL972]|eukprot:XP_011776312.1 hypothetical protein, conserved [Trypanosoma brucei gambiense DAL972]